MPMGIQKIGFRDSSCSKISYSSNAGAKGMEAKPVWRVDSEDDPDDFELTELNCELGMVEGKICSIPYELYDLSDLRDILSLDTWNSCLTEEERFYLSAYLPDMDRQTFYLTMKELFDGSNMYFGNPLDIFFKRLKGGFYPPKVACFREGLQFLQRKMYYHSVRSYHNRMAKMFIDMRRIWAECEMNTGVEERMFMWKRRNQKAINLLDLNKCPKDDEMSRDEFNLGAGLKSVESKKAANDILPFVSANGTKFMSPISSAKGVLKVKASANGPFQNQNKKIITSDVSKQHRPVPKGLLKIVPKVPSQLQQSEVGHGGAPATFMIRTQGLQDFKLSSLPTSLHIQDAGGLCDSPFLKLRLNGSKVDSTREQPLSRLHQLESPTGISHNMEGFSRNIKGEIVQGLDGISVLGKRKLFGSDVGRVPIKVREPSPCPMSAGSYRFGSPNLLPNFHIIDDISLRCLDSQQFGLQFHGGNRLILHMNEEHISTYPRISEVTQRTSDVGNSKKKMLVAPSSDQTKDETDASVRRSGKVLNQSNVSVGFKDQTALPLTYKRRKALAKVNSLDLGKPLTLEADLLPAIPKEGN